MNQRMMVHSMEPRAPPRATPGRATAIWVRSCSQAPAPCAKTSWQSWGCRRSAARHHEDVGGAFGLKTGPYPENIALMVGAKKFWPADPLDVDALRGVSQRQPGARYLLGAELALDEKASSGAGVRNIGNLGAFVGAVAPYTTANFTRACPDVRHQTIDVATTMRLHQHYPDRALSGAGRPEASYMLERVVDEAARVTGIDHQAAAAQSDQEIGDAGTRPPSARPTTAAISRRCSTRLWRSPITTASKNAAARRKSAASIAASGCACMLEHSGGSPVESAMLSFPATARLLLSLNVQNTGQGHATVFPRVIAERLGIPFRQNPASHGDSSNELPATPRSARAPP